MEVTIDVTIHDKMSELQWKGVSGGQLRYKVRARSKTIYPRCNVKAPEEEGTAEFEFPHVYKSQGGIFQTICGIEWSELLCLYYHMELLIIDANKVNPGVAIWPMKMQDLLDSVMSMAMNVAPSLAPTVGDVLEILRHEA